MKSVPFLTLVAALPIAAPAPAAENYESLLPPDAKRLALGDAPPDFKLPGIDGRTYTLADFPADKAPLLMVAFLSNHCPYSHAAETRLIPIAKEFAARGLAVVAINPNSPDSVRVDELGYSKYNDGPDEMKLYAKEKGFVFPYLYDGEHQLAAKAYGCLATPHIFLFDRARKLRYVGRVDDSRFEDPATVKTHDLRNAIVDLISGRPVATPTTPVLGCSTKWNYKRADVAKGEERWKAEPVTLDKIDAAGVAKLVKNDSNRLRLFNVWATWCQPCVEEFPALVSLARRLQGRNFELITISLDDPKQEAAAKKFLERQAAAAPARLRRVLKAEGREATNFIYTEASADPLIAALDPAWPGPLPHTVLVAPGGKILYRNNGLIDPAEMLTKILDVLGPYYTPERKQ
jgi:peroxiredoxin